MNPARRCSALFGQLCASSRGGPTARRSFSPGAVSAPAGTRQCHPGVAAGGGGGGVKGTSSGAPTAGAAAGTVHVTFHPVFNKSDFNSSRPFYLVKHCAYSSV